jgi:hypothetical protein
MEGEEAVSPSHMTYHLAKPQKEPASLMALVSRLATDGTGITDGTQVYRS